MSMLARAVAPRAIKGIDQEAMSGPYQDVRYIPIDDLQRWTGLGISPETALNYVTVYQCVSLLAETFASVPLILYRRLTNGGKERATDHPLYRVFHDQPNPTMDSFVWRELVMTHLKTWGNHYSEIVRDGLGDIQLWPIRPDRIEPKWEQGVKVYDYLSPLGGRKRMKPGSIFHVQGTSSNGLVGQSPIEILRRTISLGRTAERYGQAIFDNGARPAVALTHPKNLSEPAQTRLAVQMDALRGSGNAGKTVVLEEGMTFAEIGFPPEDAQFMETRLFQKREFAGAFRIPGGYIGDPESKDTDESQESRKFIKRAMVPEFTRFEAAALVQVIEDDDYFLEFLADGYLRGDPKARADAFAVRWEHGTLCGDEWRQYENENPLPNGEGQTYWRPANWVPLGQSEPVAVGGDASAATQFGADAGLVPNLTRVKAMSQFDCPDCGRMLNRLAAPGSVAHCRSCKAEKTFVEAADTELVA